MTSSQDYFKNICKVNRAFGSTLNHRELLDLVVENAVETMGGKAACLFLEDKKRIFSSRWPQRGCHRTICTPRPGMLKSIIN